jgi:hypothetical protein
MIQRKFFLFVLLVCLLPLVRMDRPQEILPIIANYKNAEHPAYIGQPGGSTVKPPLESALYENSNSALRHSPILIDSITLTGNNGKVTCCSSERGKEEGVVIPISI